ncbi:MAG: hypothetical protein IJT47_00805 [Selenomonadaceae bacterium]|nr:hypothetical protein [Selenomonadaceae bacterium]MBQ7492952.1 hypothetical protein [Selenomonadaceae bacterium]
MKQRLKIAAGIGVTALALAVAGGGYYHFHVNNDTPEYAIKTIQQSIEEHDTKNFYRAVNVDGVLDSSYEGIINGLTSSQFLSTPDAKENVKDFMNSLRAPLILSLKGAIDSYVAKGDLETEKNIGVAELLDRTGLNDAKIRDIKNIEVSDADKNEAFADVIIYQPDLEREFAIQLILSRGAEGQWQVSRVQNFKEYVEEIGQARRAKLEEYLAKAGEINSRHDAIINEAEKKYGLILAAGNLSKKDTRLELKTLVNDVFKKDWEERKQELFSLQMPKDAESLHSLYMKICDLAIAAANDYAKWLDDNNPATIKAAEEKIHQVQTLTTEAADLARRMTS